MNDRVSTFKCKVCGESFGTNEEKLECERTPITHDDAEIGDIVIIKQGDGIGAKALVKRKWVTEKSWGHYAWKRYWHTISLEADIVGSYGTRLLTFDSYEPCTRIKRKKKLERIIYGKEN